MVVHIMTCLRRRYLLGVNMCTFVVQHNGLFRPQAGHSVQADTYSGNVMALSESDKVCQTRRIL